MFGFIYLVGRDVLRWAVITAAVLVYVEIGPGGEALGGLVAMMVQTLLGIEWGSLAEQALAQLSVLLDALIDAIELAVSEQTPGE